MALTTSEILSSSVECGDTVCAEGTVCRTLSPAELDAAGLNRLAPAELARLLPAIERELTCSMGTPPARAPKAAAGPWWKSSKS